MTARRGAGNSVAGKNAELSSTLPKNLKWGTIFFERPFSDTKFEICSVVNAQKVQKYALNSQLQALQSLTNDDEVED